MDRGHPAVFPSGKNRGGRGLQHTMQPATGLERTGDEGICLCSFPYTKAAEKHDTLQLFVQ